MYVQSNTLDSITATSWSCATIMSRSFAESRSDLSNEPQLESLMCYTYRNRCSVDETGLVQPCLPIKKHPPRRPTLVMISNVRFEDKPIRSVKRTCQKARPSAPLNLCHGAESRHRSGGSNDFFDVACNVLSLRPPTEKRQIEYLDGGSKQQEAVVRTKSVVRS